MNTSPLPGFPCPSYAQCLNPTESQSGSYIWDMLLPSSALRIFMNRDTSTNISTLSHPELHMSVDEENGAQPLLEYNKETRLGRFPGSQSQGDTVLTSLPPRIWDVPQNQQLNMAEVNLKNNIFHDLSSATY